jgi:hypothetical protein
MRSRVLSIFLILCILTAVQFVYGQAGKLQIAGNVRFPDFIKAGEKFQVKINMKGGPVDDNKVTLLISFSVAVVKHAGSGHTMHTREVHGTLANDTATFSMQFTDPGQRSDVSCRIRYSVGGTEYETNAVPANLFLVER